MSSCLPSTAQLLQNIRKYTLSSKHPINSIWPPHRRSAVMIILFYGNRGELRVLLTKRSRNLRAFSGHVSLPGGKADDMIESPLEVARRECFEEIGLPLDDKELTEQGLKLEVLNTLPCYLSRTFLSVKPVVCFLRDLQDEAAKINSIKFNLNPGETSSIFSVPLLDLLYDKKRNEHLPKDYRHEFIKRTNVKYSWGLIPWPLKHYFYPNVNEHEILWLDEVVDLSSDEDLTFSNSETSLKEGNVNKLKDIDGIKDVWGLTAQIIHDLALISIDKAETATIGNDNLIYGLTELGGQMLQRKRSEWESGMIDGENRFDYSQVIPRYYFTKLVKDFKSVL
ncbi:hypothetical protein WICPIJ_000652 [Wickerhamomyces pijperi]|uniref:Nudix hydrolase domain-containing protein n=1 Tax=Wickerhamomyces pijperi TaxID=599730 RepID=A0A9P8QFI4_WICPI|nr:hypothetical protein WICPIJ_000652 [Wickerhamomyces pijperi]